MGALTKAAILGVDNHPGELTRLATPRGTSRSPGREAARPASNRPPARLR